VDAQLGQGVHRLGVEVGNRLRRQGDTALVSVAGTDQQLVSQEVELKVERTFPVRDGRGGQAARADVQRHLPPVG
jgi:hypothetical protein